VTEDFRLPISLYVKLRNKAFRTANEEDIKRVYAANGVEPPENPIVFWAAFHKARTSWPDCPLELRMNSLQWLMMHNMKPGD
jgi:hypothetical protein